MPIGSHSHAWSHSTHRCVHCGIYAALGALHTMPPAHEHQVDTVTIARDDLVWLLHEVKPDAYQSKMRAAGIATDAGVNLAEEAIKAAEG